jgi:hypothetical protein
MATEQIQTVNKEMLQHLSDFSGPVPGQSLTNSPDSPQPYERPPSYTTLSDALYGLFEMLTEEEMFKNMINAMSDSVPVTALAQVVLTDGFQKGAWNPDLMVQLIEPTMYMIMSLAEKVGIKYRIDEEDNPDVQLIEGSRELEFFNEFEKAVMTKSKSIDDSAIPEKIKTKITELEVPTSLLAKTSEIEQGDNSLLARGEM